MNEGIQIVQRINTRGRGRKELGFRKGERLVQAFGDIEVVEFFVPVVPSRGNCIANGVVNPFGP